MSRRKVVAFKRRQVGGPPKDEPWSWNSATRMRSPAWRGASFNLRRLLDFLELEHMRHRGRMNGRLLAPYDDLVKFGITRRLVTATIREGEERGLIVVDYGFRLGNGQRQPSRFRLTYFESRTVDPKTKIETWFAATDDWKRYTASQPARVNHPKKIVLRGYEGEPEPVPDEELGSNKKPRKSAKRQIPDEELGENRENAPIFEPESPAELPKTKFPFGNSVSQVPDEELPIHMPGGSGAGTPAATSQAGEAAVPHGIGAGISSPGRKCRFYVTNEFGFRLCGQPVGADGVNCIEHQTAAARLPC